MLPLIFNMLRTHVLKADGWMKIDRQIEDRYTDRCTDREGQTDREIVNGYSINGRDYGWR